MTRLCGALVLATLLGGNTGAAAAPCPPAAAVTGEPALAQAIAELLAARGIAEAAPPGCALVRARVAARGDAVAISFDGAEGELVERSAGSAATAATVIEAFARVADVGAPLLAERLPPPPPRPRREVGIDRVTASPIPRPPVDTTGAIYLALERTIANDETRWEGVQVGGCVRLGLMCPGARLRFATVIQHPVGLWSPELRRIGIELLFGVDMPFRIGPLKVAPGFDFGFGAMRTTFLLPGQDPEEEGTELSQTGGLRADLHMTVALPVYGRFAIALFVSGMLTQATRTRMVDGEMEVPVEPRGLLRVGLGVRFGGT